MSHPKPLSKAIPFILLLIAILVILFIKRPPQSGSLSDHHDNRSDPHGQIGRGPSSPETISTTGSESKDPSSSDKARLATSLPLPEDLHSSLVTAEIEVGETLVMGGYRKPDGSHEFILITPKTVAIEGQDSLIQLESRVLSYDPEHLEQNGLAGMATEKRNADGRSQVWRLEERSGSLQQAKQFTASPTITVTPGEAAKVQIGQEDGGEGFSIEVTATQTEAGSFSIQALSERNMGGNH